MENPSVEGPQDRVDAVTETNFRPQPTHWKCNQEIEAFGATIEESMENA